MGFDNIDSFELDGVEQKDFTSGRYNMAGVWWGVGWGSEGGGCCLLRKRVCKVAVLG
jgi:hypothetical protein